jgi:hypothetical protein
MTGKKRQRNGMKGILKTFETVIGLTMVMFAFILLYTSQESFPDFDTVSWKSSGQKALESIDHTNQLRYDALNNNTAALEDRLRGYLPPNTDIMVVVCGQTCPTPTITAKKSTSAHYLISGDADNSTSKEVILYVWSNE